MYMKYLFSFFIILLSVACNERAGKGVTGNDTLVAEQDSPQEQNTPAGDTVVEPFNEMRWLQQKVLEGTDFIGTGNEPFWSVEISFDSIMKFKTADGDSIITPAVQGIRLQDVAATGYRAETENGILSVIIFDQKCVDDMSGIEKPKMVKVDYKEQSYSGCGQFTYDYRLDDIWVLESVNGNRINTGDFDKGHPRLEIKIKDSRIMGMAGCNNFNGTVEFQGTKIKTNKLMSTKMACNAMEFETRLLGSLTDKLIDYKIENLRLNLQVSQDSLLVFKKVD